MKTQTMAKFVSFRALDTRNLPDPTTASISETRLSNSTYTLTADGVTIRLQGSGFHTETPAGVDPWFSLSGRIVGHAETATLIADGQTYFIATDMNYAVGNDYAEQGFNYEGVEIYGLRGELAAWLAGKDEVSGSSGNDWLEGFGGNDLLTGFGGNDTLDGGTGVDTAKYFGPASQYAISSNTAGHRMIDGGDLLGTDTLINVERVQFEDKTLAFDLGQGGNAGWAARIVGTLVGKSAVNDKALAGEVISYVDTFGAQTVTELLVSLGITGALAGGADNASFFTHIYKNVVGKMPSQAELAELVGYVDSGAFTQAQALEVIAGLDLTASKIGLPDLAQMGWGYDFYAG